MKMAICCEKMNWTYQEYISQPNWFIELLLLKWNIENEVNKKQNGKR